MAILPAPVTGASGILPPTADAQPSSGGILPQLAVVGASSLSTLGGTPAIATGAFETPQAYSQSALGQMMMQKQVETVAGQTGLPPEEALALIQSGASQATPEGVQTDIESAIARIATYNEDLAADLAAKYQGGVDPNNSLWDNIKDTVGDILSPAVAVGAKALDILIRPSQIVPELIVDKEDDPWYEDVFQALSGNSKAHGSDVMEKWGVENGLAKGILGFAFDVAVDPLTWTGFGLLGRGRQVASEATQMVLGRGFLVESLVNAGKGADEAAVLAERAWGKLTQIMPNISEDAALGIAGQSVSKLPVEELVRRAATATRGGFGVDTELLVAAMKFADPGVEAVKQTGKIAQGMKLAGHDDATILKAIGMLKQARTGAGREALGLGKETSGWVGRNASAALGGIRMRAGVPFTQHRFTSAAIPGSERFGFDIFRNFFRGQSGLNRLGQALVNMDSVDPALRQTIMREYAERGIRGLQDAHGGVFEQVFGGRKFSSMFYEQSHRMGQATAGLSPSALAYRNGGIASNMAIAAKREARALKGTFAEKYMYTLRAGFDPDNAEGKDFKQVAGIIKNNLKNKPEDMERYGAAFFRGEAVDISPEEAEALTLIKKLFHQGTEYAEKFGFTGGYRYGAVEGVDVIRNKTVPVWHGGYNDITRNVTFRMEVDNIEGGVAGHPMNATAGEVHGFQLTALDETNAPDIAPAVHKDLRGIVDEGANLTGVRDVLARNLPDVPEKELNNLSIKFGLWAESLSRARATRIGTRKSTSKYKTADERADEYLQHERMNRLGIHSIDDIPDDLKRTADGKMKPKVELEAMFRPGIVDRLPEGHPWRAILSDKNFNPETVLDDMAGSTVKNQVAARFESPLVFREGVDPTMSDASDILAVRTKLDEDFEAIQAMHLSEASEADLLMAQAGDKPLTAADLQGMGKTEDEFAEWATQKKAELMSAWVRGRGADGIVYADENGRVLRATVLTSDPKTSARGSNVIRVDDVQGQDFLDDDGVPLLFTETFQRAVWGERKAGWKNGVEDLTPDLRREFDKATTYEEKIAAARKLLGEKTKYEGKVFIEDPREALAKYTDWLGDRVVDTFKGKVAEHIAHTFGAAGVSGVVATRVLAAKDTYLHGQNFAALSSSAKQAIREMKEVKKSSQAQIAKIAKEAGVEKAVLEQRVIRLREAIAEQAEAGVTYTKTAQKELDRLDAEIERLGKDLSRARSLRKQIADYDPRQTKRVAGRSPEEIQANISKAKFGPRKETLADLQAELDNLPSEMEILATLSERKTQFDEIDRWFKSSADDKQKYITPKTSTAVDAARKQVGQAQRKVTTVTKTFADDVNIEAAKEIDRLRTGIETAQREANKLAYRTRAEAARLAPAWVEEGIDMPGFIDVSGLHPTLKGVKMHPYIAAEFSSVPKGIGSFRQWFRQTLQGPWKKWATIYYPGFHARNNMGAMFNNFIGGVTVEDYADAFRVSRALSGSKKMRGKAVDQKKLNRWGIGWLLNNETLGRAPTYEDLGHLMARMGVRGTNSQGFADIRPMMEELRILSGANASDARRLLGMGKATSKAAEVTKNTVGKPFAAYGKGARAATDITENFHRQAAFFAGLSHTAGSLSGARAFTMMRHGDYEDLNDFEEGIKDLLPFYKWMRTNLPYQIHNLLEAPGAQLAVLKTREAAYAAQGENWEERKNKMPDYMQEMLTIPLPGGVDGDGALELLTLDLPMSDLHQGANDFLSSMLPMVKPLIESFILEKSLFTGSPLEGKRVPLAKFADNAAIRPVLDAMGLVEVDANGRATIEDKAQNLVSMIPIFSRFRNWIFSDPNSQERRATSFFSTVMGVRPQTLDESTEIAADYDFLFNEVEPIAANLRELGVFLPDKTMLSPEIWERLGFELPATEEATPAGLPSLTTT